MDKQAAWEAMKEKSRKVGKYNKPTDPGILDTVAVLRLMGFTILDACEGRIDQAPYVFFQIKNSETRKKMYTNALLEYGLKAPQTLEELKKNEIKSISERKRLFPYLNEFYATRSTPQAERIIIERAGVVGGSLLPQNAILVDSNSGLPAKTRQDILVNNQKEMTQFTAFLKQKYFAEARQKNRVPSRVNV